VAVRYLPFFAVEGLPDTHIGREWDMPVDFRAMSGKDRFASSGGSVTYAVDPDERALWGAPPTVHVRAEHQGRFAFPAQARRGPVRLTSTLHFRGRRELANPLLPLRVGNRWLYRVVTKGDWGGFAYVVPLGGERSEDRLELKITGVDERSGLRTFTLAALGGDGSIRESKVVAMDGETLTVEDDGTVGPPAISGTEEACTLGLLGRPGGITDDEVSGTCQAGGADADMLPSTLPDPKHPGAKPVPLRFALAGPASLRIGPSLGAEAGKWVLGIMTGGAVIVPVRSTTVYTLVETQRGPEGAPEAPTASR
jgi:hypothetical protein